jgi:carbamoyl-phosphate synthase large subunit
LSGVDPWFLFQIKQIVEMESEIGASRESLSDKRLRLAKEWGFSDIQLAYLTHTGEEEIKQRRHDLNIKPVYKLVDTCAAEFKAATPYYYSTYEAENEARVSDREKVIILGGGPNRIGQGIEFDYCCVHASFALREEGIESIMVNSNPETVSTDYDTSERWKMYCTL